ncbi:MAG: cytochrome c oxidase subunit 4 [Mariniblastus sp.]|jgi:cytochrome c oxidase subunit 4
MSDQNSDLPSFCHPAAPKMLFAVFFGLIFLTILTVVTSATGKMMGIPPAFTFPIAMMIATAKAFLVCAFFMHMWWDKGFNILAFFSSLLFVSLFIGMTLMDSSHYQDSIEAFDVQQLSGVEVSDD